MRELGVGDVADITSDVAYGFIMLPSRHGSTFHYPSESTQKGRRSAIRALYETARTLGFRVFDPTWGLPVDSLGPRTGQVCSWSDICALREGAPAGMCTSGLPAVLAFAEAGASNTEISSLRGCSVDLAMKSVSLPGTGSLRPRTNQLTEWGCVALSARLDELSNMEHLVVSTMGKDELSQGAVSNAFRQITKNARLHTRGLRLDAVRAWRAHDIFTNTGRIETAAHFLGLKTLDGTARFINYDWRTAP